MTMRTYLEENMTLAIRKLHIKDGPTVESDKRGGKRKEFQVETIDIRDSNITGRTVTLWGFTKIGGVRASVARTYRPDHKLPDWLAKYIG